MTFVLEARRIDKSFDGAPALRGVDFDLAEGEVHALLGENGAGKSTLSKIFAGVLTPDEGEICVRGSPVEIASPMHAQRLGIGMVFQELDLFPHLSVAENLAAANRAASECFFVHPRALNLWCGQFLDHVGLSVDPRTPLHALSVSQRQLVAIARAVSMRARIILMDEPTSSLPQTNVEALFTLLAKLKRDGVSIVYVSHKMEEVQRISDRITVLRDGVRVATDNANARSTEELITAMVGRSLRSEPRPRRAPGSVVLDLRSLATNHVSGISFRLRSGEVLGLAGLVGSGRSEIGAALFGLRGRCRIDARLGDRVFAPTNAADAIAAGFCLLPEERRTDALFPHMSTLENTTICVLERLRQHGLIRSNLERAAAHALFERLRLAADKSEASIVNLSGGNQQKAIVARWLLVEPRVLFLDEPTRGIDVGAKEQIYGLIDELARLGMGVVLVSSELPELLRCCDRILVLHKGRAAGIVDVASTSQEEILTLATGVRDRGRTSSSIDNSETQ
jgi:ABC-type sugar transport system ATPase subunit